MTIRYQLDWYCGSSGLYHISRTGNGTVMDCVVSVGYVPGSGGLYRISRPSSGIIMYCVVSVRLILGHLWTVSNQFD